MNTRCLFVAALASLAFAAAAQDDYTLLVFGDGGSGKPKQKRVAAAMAEVCEQSGCDAALVLGDLIYQNGVKSVDDRKFKTHFEEPYGILGPFSFWMTPGNHDHRGSVDAQVAYARSGRSVRWKMPAAHYAVESLPSWLHVYALDTEPIADEAADGTQLNEARAALCGKPGWRLLMGHHAIYSNGDHGDNADVASYLDGVIRDCDVQAYFAGHDHHQEHISAPTFEQFIQGAASKLRDVETRSYAAGTQMTQRFARSTLGFAVAAFTRRTMDVRFFDATDGRAREIYRCRATVEMPSCVP